MKKFTFMEEHKITTSPKVVKIIAHLERKGTGVLPNNPFRNVLVLTSLNGDKIIDFDEYKPVYDIHDENISKG